MVSCVESEEFAALFQGGSNGLHTFVGVVGGKGDTHLATLSPGPQQHSTIDVVSSLAALVVIAEDSFLVCEGARTLHDFALLDEGVDGHRQ